MLSPQYMVYKSKDWGLHSSIQLPIMAQVSPSEDEFDGEFDIDIEKTTKSPSTSLSDSSAIMMSKHSMNMGCYEINLGTVRGQRIHALHLILLPLLPILILIVQNYSTFDFNKVRKKFCFISMDWIPVGNLSPFLELIIF